MEEKEGGPDVRKGKKAWSKRQEERGEGREGAEMDGGEEIGCLVLIACAKSIVAD